jgi:hypothetical protein
MGVNNDFYLASSNQQLNGHSQLSFNAPNFIKLSRDLEKF